MGKKTCKTIAKLQKKRVDVVMAVPIVLGQFFDSRVRSGQPSLVWT